MPKEVGSCCFYEVDLMLVVQIRDKVRLHHLLSFSGRRPEIFASFFLSVFTLVRLDHIETFQPKVRGGREELSIIGIDFFESLHSPHALGVQGGKGLGEDEKKENQGPSENLR